jgi:hypothetical protein
MTAMIRLVCGHQGRRRPVTVFAYDGPLPVPAGYTPRGHSSSIELRCRYCGFAPRPGDEGLRALLSAAAGLPRMTLDINPRPPGGWHTEPGQ